MLFVYIVKKFSIQSKSNKIQYEDFIDKISNLLNYCVNELGFQLVFIPFFTSRDDRAHTDILEQMTDTKRIPTWRTLIY